MENPRQPVRLDNYFLSNILIHTHAKKASISVSCADEQEQYWAMHNTQFDAHGQVTDDLIDNTIK